jgi:hypothetical protein
LGIDYPRNANVMAEIERVAILKEKQDAKATVENSPLSALPSLKLKLDSRVCTLR